eukprot:2836738-Heterocapsa_arctica.AAC.2
MAFQVRTSKESRTRGVPEGDFTEKEGTLDEDWIRWNESSENYLGQVEDKLVRILKAEDKSSLMLIILSVLLRITVKDLPSLLK